MGDGPKVPHDADVEEALLGAMTLAQGARDDAFALDVSPGDFYVTRNGHIFDAIQELDVAGEPVDLVTIQAELERAGHGGIVTIDELVAIQRHTPATTNARRYAAILLDLAGRRRAMSAAYAVIDSAREGNGWAEKAIELGKLAEATSPTTSALSVRWVHDVVEAPPEEPPELVSGFLRAGELAVIVAPRKLGKSWLGMQLAALLDTGKGKFLGRLDVARQARVLIAQGELNPWGSYSRWRHLVGPDGTPPTGVAESFDRWGIKTQTIRRTHRDAAGTASVEEQVAKVSGQLEAAIIEHGFDVVVIDPWAVFFHGKENSNDEVEAALGELRGITLRTGAAFVIIHHVSKASEAREPEDLWRGAGRLADWASTGLTMMPHYKTSKAWKSAGLDRQKAKWYADLFFMRRDRPTKDFSVRWDPATGWWEEWVPQGDPDDGRLAGIAVGDIEAALVAAGGRWGSIRAAAEAIGRSPHTAAKYLNQAIKAGLIEECPGDRSSGKGYRLSTANHVTVDQLTLGGSTEEPELEEVPVDAYDDEEEPNELEPY